MNYFTADLLDRYGSDDDAIADQAQADWERASDAYSSHYKSIEPALPARLREVLGQYALHDARLLSGALTPPFLFMTLQPDRPPHEILLFRYHLVKPPEFLAHEPVSDVCPYSEWLYDELYARHAVGHYPYFEQQILLTNGHELHLSFTDFDCLVQLPFLRVVAPTAGATPSQILRAGAYPWPWMPWTDGGGWHWQRIPDQAG